MLSGKPYSLYVTLLGLHENSTVVDSEGLQTRSLLTIDGGGWMGEVFVLNRHFVGKCIMANENTYV